MNFEVIDTFMARLIFKSAGDSVEEGRVYEVRLCATSGRQGSCMSDCCVKRDLKRPDGVWIRVLSSDIKRLSAIESLAAQAE